MAKKIKLVAKGQKAAAKAAAAPDLATQMASLARAAKAASRLIANADTEKKNRVILEAAELIERNASRLVIENAKDIAAAEKAGKNKAFIDRLTLNEKRIASISSSLREIAVLPDPVGRTVTSWNRPNGMTVSKVRVPIGVICMIYESRPNVTADAAALCIKSGNAVILRGGSESINSNVAIHKLITQALQKVGLPSDAVQLVLTTDRAAISELVKQDKYIDVVMPRGGDELIRTVVENSRVPVIKHYKGVCHVYIDEYAELPMAERIAFNAKVQRPGTCNAMETLLVNKKAAGAILPPLAHRLVEAGVRMKVDEESFRILKKAGIDMSRVQRAKEQDYYTEWLDLVMSVKQVRDLDEAIAHITKYGTSHSDAIVTQNYERAMRFLKEVDSAAVYVNASTRLTDGGEFGLGAELGISTDKLHARGPVGLEELTTTKWVIFGSGQIRQ